jgi:hypothetical protein
LKLNDTSKSINLNSDEGDSTSEGNNPWVQEDKISG